MEGRHRDGKCRQGREAGRGRKVRRQGRVAMKEDRIVRVKKKKKTSKLDKGQDRRQGTKIGTKQGRKILIGGRI